MLAAVLLLGGLAACSPEPLPVLGLAVVEDRPVVVLVPCNGYSEVSVYPRDGDSTGPNLQWRADASSVTEVTELVLLAEPPPGWQGAAAAGALRPQVQYNLSGASGSGARTVPFTLEDLQGLPAGRVLTADRNGAKEMDRAEFESQARKSCP